MRFKTMWDNGPEDLLLVSDRRDGRFMFLHCQELPDGDDRYWVGLQYVALQEIGPQQLEDAARCCGVDDKLGKVHEADMLRNYGSYAPLGQWQGCNWRKLVKQARAHAHELEDPTKLEDALNQPANQLGSTAREFMQGDLNSAMTRGCCTGQQNARLIAKMYGIPQDKIDGMYGKTVSGAFAASMQIKKIPGDDPCAYSMGFLCGVAGGPLNDDPSVKCRELADQYIKGYQAGVDVRAGRSSMPEWCKPV